MRILSIETSCDETAVSLLSIAGDANSPGIKTLGNALFSQVNLHAQYGGVYPNLAKREHQKNLIPLFRSVLTESKSLKSSQKKIVVSAKTKKILEREPELLRQFLDFLPTIRKPKIDAIAVTTGPGLEPALWVGISFAKALGNYWNIPVIPINHMEGHIMSVLFEADKAKGRNEIRINYPLIALLISGGHTELVYAQKPLKYKSLGQTRDDAVGEAYDKVARMLDLPYPGGPEVSRLAEEARKLGIQDTKLKFPRPMINSKDLDFSFSGLKTSVLYFIDGRKLSRRKKMEIAREFEDAVTEVLLRKTQLALLSKHAKTLVVGGGVIANSHIRESLKDLVKNLPNTKLLIPTRELSTDNSKMIGVTAYIHLMLGPKRSKKKGAFSARGNLRLSS
ncbi:MAG: hypothetical protein A2741_00700 [Candidatus Zambryskibacteria bacterium RIFCSPHIGHO2_01_FULL_43_27]|uniref:tRNA N6-adenosine threonylcarbamoyltransferase n=1 Tax=Candidatus Zambryskibacteria bacterium RIFCSPLOWO2_01_FULL_43_17 TaxID=1802760 RepID=A0A1G2U2N3_9BACT|nr:MAG: hypothetical protein A2741_00700 [Candidatus Zambryskibacteria bacterium RIFCSPHIGHO2_01_FULL_43_27]OHB00315.1 MAG: hypothetical protein A3E93_00405 [Candidatus Zambryskibacteria bacterium RIFCSPHIGHO2_12_FULL_43_12b]OHB03787.1 MAG: hypothetical protein A2920_01920 [Candidatus Zambryskibacteria bacterium RIFCSPLOWO2_01_FULL_43_17]